MPFVRIKEGTIPFVDKVLSQAEQAHLLQQKRPLSKQRRSFLRTHHDKASDTIPPLQQGADSVAHGVPQVRTRNCQHVPRKNTLSLFPRPRGKKSLFPRCSSETELSWIVLTVPSTRKWRRNKATTTSNNRARKRKNEGFLVQHVHFRRRDHRGTERRRTKDKPTDLSHRRENNQVGTNWNICCPLSWPYQSTNVHISFYRLFGEPGW